MERIQEPVRRLVPPNGLLRALAVSLLLILGGIVAQRSGWFSYIDSGDPPSVQEQILFSPVDSVQEVEVPLPVLTDQRILLNYPSYTGLSNQSTADPNIRALAGTVISWELQFDGPVSEVWMETEGSSIPLLVRGEVFRLRRTLEESAFYGFRFRDSLGRSQVSDLYALQVIRDKAPEIVLAGVPQYSTFEPGQKATLDLNARISDDFGLGEAYIVATVSKGSGEAVKFREERLSFETPAIAGKKEALLKGRLDLQDLGMATGDELYFYVEATDLKAPAPNRGRSETFFAVVRDTVSSGFAVEANLGVDLMPDYFRSQRQLIIDTEKLIAESTDRSSRDFKSRSNELGFDQKALRIKYGQFMGEEQELELAPLESGAEASDHTHGEEEKGEASEAELLEDYTHDHDGDNEHYLVAEAEAGDQEDPLHAYLHDHGDPEAATLFEESLRTKLRKALAVMWDAELHLRLFNPEESLPYQYKALKLIQDIKNSARIYVHRIGFDPPPIKEDKRLTGDVSGLENAVRETTLEYRGTYPAMRSAVARLDELISGRRTYSGEDASGFQQAGEELAAMALESPGRYLSALRALRATETETGRRKASLRALRKALLQALPEAERVPFRQESRSSALDSLFLQEIRTHG